MKTIDEAINILRNNKNRKKIGESKKIQDKLRKVLREFKNGEKNEDEIAQEISEIDLAKDYGIEEHSSGSENPLISAIEDVLANLPGESDTPSPGDLSVSG
ncbi:hypothetical protein QUF64_07030 [Anaerolineales bacterium HSG6]|nr:hypothetical protein [Anaerolineales bacterium HSG6]